MYHSSALAAVLDDHKEIFRKELGTITCAKAEIHVRRPSSFHRPRLIEAEGRSRTRATGDHTNSHSGQHQSWQYPRAMGLFDSAEIKKCR